MQHGPTDPLWDEEDFDISLASECTGLIPTPPKTSGELASYRNLAPLPREQKNKRKEK